MMRPEQPRLALLVALPQLVVVAIAGVILVLGAAGRDPQWRDVSVNLPSAFAAHDWGQGIRRVGQGEDPLQPAPVPDWNPRDHVQLMSALEAAVREDELHLVATLVRAGAQPPPAERLRLSCLAVTRDAPEIAMFLNGVVPDAAACAATGAGAPQPR